MSLSVEQFAQALSAAGLVPAPELEAIVEGLPAEQRGELKQFAKQLVKQSKLTLFQANEALQGRAARLVLGDYVILDKIGAGGMGQVFKARHRRMDRIVAIKMLPSSAVKSPEAVARFQREVKAAARLEHPSIVTAYDAGENRGAHFLVMQYVAGLDLSRLVKQNGPLPVDKAVRFVLQAARGLAYAHTKGVIHRDIKPANLLVDHEENVKILDMGLARLDDPLDAASVSDGLTQTGQTMGTAAYMAPEQAFDTRGADARSDIYSLGCTLCRLLTGEDVFPCENLTQMILAHRELPVPSLRVKRPEVPPALDALFARMMAKRPADRFQTMDQVIAALEPLSVGRMPLAPVPLAQAVPVAPAIALAAAIPEAAPPTDLSAMLFDPQAAAAERKTSRGSKSLTRLPDEVVLAKPISMVVKLVGGTFATIVAPILVTYLIKYMERQDKPAPAPVAASLPTAAPSVTPPVASAATSPASRSLAATNVAPVSPPVAAPAASTAPPVAMPAAPAAVAAPTASVATSLPTDVNAPPAAVAPFDAGQARAHREAWAAHLGTTVETMNSLGMKLVLVPAGEFQMGMTGDQLEVTVGQFRQFVQAVGYRTEAERDGKGGVAQVGAEDRWPQSQDYLWSHPGYEQADDFPVVEVSWGDAIDFCNWLSRQEGRGQAYIKDSGGLWIRSGENGYRLPTEAEWEFACRAGTTTQYSFGDDVNHLEQYAWVIGNSGGNPHPVASKPANAFGLFDMHGNVYERCQDFMGYGWYEKSPTIDPQGPTTGTDHINRGGHCNCTRGLCTSAIRANQFTWYRNNRCGFRVATPPILGSSQASPMASSAPGVPPAARALRRSFWKHEENGKTATYQETAGGQWVATSMDGNRFNFELVESTAEYVELIDRSRDISVRLYEGRCELRVAPKPYRYFQPGEWVAIAPAGASPTDMSGPAAGATPGETTVLFDRKKLTGMKFEPKSRAGLVRNSVLTMTKSDVALVSTKNEYSRFVLTVELAASRGTEAWLGVRLQSPGILTQLPQGLGKTGSELVFPDFVLA